MTKKRLSRDSTRLIPAPLSLRSERNSPFAVSTAFTSPQAAASHRRMASNTELSRVAAPLADLHKLLDVTSFRPGQAVCIDGMSFHGRDAWVGFACGGGKSLVYAATMLQKGGIGLLVEPLNAITDAMELYFTERGIEVIALRTAKDSSNACAALRDGRSDGVRPLVIVGSPERMLARAMIEAMSPSPAALDQAAILTAALASVSLKPFTCRVTLIGIDEAHIVAQWGAAFREAFARLGELRDAASKWLFDSHVLCIMTATAAPLVRAAVKHSLRWREDRCVEVLHSLHRPNILLRVHVPGNVSGLGVSLSVKTACVLTALKRPGVVLVFVETPGACASVARRLRTEGGATGVVLDGGAIEVYHGELSTSVCQLRRKNFENAAAGTASGGSSASASGGTTGVELRCLVCTIAFGMGIDISSGVNSAIIWDVPPNLSDLYQMAQRAGRDGTTLCHIDVYTSESTRQKHKRRGITELRRADSSAVASSASGLKYISECDTVYRFAMNANNTCRHVLVDEIFEVPLEARMVAPCRTRCDVCMGTVKLQSPTPEQELAIDFFLKMELTATSMHCGKTMVRLCSDAVEDGLNLGEHGVKKKIVAFRVRVHILAGRLEDAPSSGPGGEWTIRRGPNFIEIQGQKKGKKRGRKK